MQYEYWVSVESRSFSVDTNSVWPNSLLSLRVCQAKLITCSDMVEAVVRVGVVYPEFVRSYASSTNSNL